TAILSADVKGYSRLMGADEEGTLRTLTAYREEMLAIIRQHRGRFVGSAGDSVLAEFASVVDAVQCAVVMQATLKAENASLPPNRRMEFRIGINLGDVMVDGEQIYGDGVNIAARLESLADAGGICISGTVHEHIKNKLTLNYEDLGEQQVKNIAEPVRVWRVRMEESRSPASEARSPASKGQDLQPRRVGRVHRAWVVVVGLVLIVGVIVTVRYFARPPLSTQDSALRTESAPAALPLPDKPSIVVLPFVNMSKDPDQDYFGDGITEDLTTSLSQISSLFVIARNSAFTYKGRAVKVQDVGRELGVRYVLEGSVRKADNQVRITAQLVDALTDSHIWAERYDRPLKDIFALQDEIVQKIVTTLKLQLTLQEQGYIVRKHTDNLEAYDSLLRGIEHVFRRTKEANTQAQQLFEKAISLDPEFAEAYAWLGATYYAERFNQWSADPAQSLERALELAQQAMRLDDSLPTAHVVLSVVYRDKKQYEQALAEAEQAITLAPNFSGGYLVLGGLLNLTGQAEKAIGVIEQSQRLDPHSPVQYQLVILGWAYFLTRQYDKAIATQQKVLSRNRNFLDPHLILTISYSELSREEEARAEAGEVLRISPKYSLDVVRQTWPYKNPADMERTLAALHKAGLK
ncbi:MAG: adenylate/guanylate cyclase domain-containing protein, partial [Deltaproteobacteria bacterium]|nr:adenylate/guanylate cyclase domain-containing protein [Deltaproteobacteria bacterium]